MSTTWWLADEDMPGVVPVEIESVGESHVFVREGEEVRKRYRSSLSPKYFPSELEAWAGLARKFKSSIRYHEDKIEELKEAAVKTQMRVNALSEELCQ